MKAAGAAGVVTGGFAGIAAAQDDCADVSGACDDCKDTGCDATKGSCTSCLTGGCTEIADTRLEAGSDFSDGLYCLEVSADDIPDTASKAVIKAANDCHECEIIDPTQSQTFCIDGQNAISHIEFAECPDADVTVDCPNDRARIDVDLTDSVYFEVDYDQCDASDESGTLTFSDDAAGGTEDDWHAFVALADCEGTITVWNSSSKDTQFDSAPFDCESGTVTADCVADKITVSADDTQDLWYEIDFDNCDVADVDRTMVSGLDTADTVTILEPIPNCEGTVTLYEDEGSTSALDSDTFDCVTASVTVDCALDKLDDATATISAPDADTVWYEIDYADCDESDVGRTEVDLSTTDSVTFDIAECDGTISVWDAASGGEMLASATIDCADADVGVTCSVDTAGDATATIDSPDMNQVWYEIDYDDCDESDVSRTSLDFSSTDSRTFDIAECDGTITVFDGASSDATEIASADIDCADAQVTVDCVAEEATITAADTDVVEYEIVYAADCGEADVPRTQVTLGDDDEATVAVADCAGTITVYDLEGDELASASFDCLAEVTALGADCDLVTADFTDFVAGDQVSIAVDVKDSTGSTITTLSSGTVTMESGGDGGNVTVNDTDGDGVFEQLVYTYSNELSSGTSWQTVDVSVLLVDQNRFLDADPTTDGFQQTNTFDVGPCGCPDCPTDLEVKFEDPGIEVCDANDGFVVTDVTRDSQGELESVCVATLPERPVYCELGICVKAGPETEKQVVEPTTTTFDETQCGFDVNGDSEVTADATISEYCVSSFNDKGISHITIVCPDATCPENEGPGGGPNK